MNLELLIILVLITVFLISCCGLLQKIRNYYNDEAGGHIIAISQVRVANQMYNNNAYQTGPDELNNGVFPGGYAPPPYTETELQPPKYEDVLKSSNYTVLQIDPNVAAVVPSQDVQTTQVNGQTVNLPSLPAHLEPARVHSTY